MFYLSRIEHTLRLPPHLLSLRLEDAVRGELEKLFLDKVEFTLIMFRPFVGEIIVAKLKESTANGLLLFAEDYRDRVVWIWKFPDSDEELVIDGIDQIKFQVHSVNFPPIPIEQPEDSKPFAPMVVTGSIDFDGLGLVSWWVDAEDKDEEPEDP